MLGALVVDRLYGEVGTLVRMRCEGGDGWWRYGHQLTTSRRALVRDGQLFIYPALLSDSGEYLCNGQLTYLTVTGIL